MVLDKVWMLQSCAIRKKYDCQYDNDLFKFYIRIILRDISYVLEDDYRIHFDECFNAI